LKDLKTNNMTAKEKAERLLDRMKFNCRECDNDFKAKQCALIAVEEIIKSNPHSPSELHPSPHFKAIEYWKALEYWQEVKQEIEKL